MRTILLTGATGFLGSHLLEALLKEKYQVVVLKRSTSNIWRIRHLLQQVKSYDIDLEPVENAFSEQHIDIVFHTACHYGRDDDSITRIVASNLMLGLDVLENGIRFKTSAILNADTLLQKHLNVYTLSKKQFVEWLKNESGKIQVVNLKLEHMYGPKDDGAKFVPWVINQLKGNVPEIMLTKGEQERDFIYISDVVSAFMLIVEKLDDLDKFTEFDVGTGKLITIQSFLKKLKQSYVAGFGASPTTLAFGRLPYREGEIMRVQVNNQPLLDLGWESKVQLNTGLKHVINEKIGYGNVVNTKKD